MNRVERFSRLLGMGLTASLCWAVFGCGGGEELPELYTASGVVTYKGNPVPKAKIVFVPDVKSDPKKPAPPRPWAEADENGKFEVFFGDGNEGAPAGKYKVIVTAFKEYGPEDDTELKPESLIPEKYASPASSTLVKEIKAQDENKVDLPLED